MTRDEIAHAKTAYNCAISALRGFVSQFDYDMPQAQQFVQLMLDHLRYLETAIEAWSPTPDPELVTTCNHVWTQVGQTHAPHYSVCIRCCERKSVYDA